MKHNALLASYGQFKEWSHPKYHTVAAFENLLAAAGKAGPLAILEFGFGHGRFLDWAREAGHQVSGIDILPEAIAAAQLRGHDVHLAEAAASLGPFDLLLAMDVLEHLDQPQMFAFFDLAVAVLKDDGCIVARFPNGASPFSGYYQYSDLTHQSRLTPRAIQQLAMIKGFRLVRALNPRPVPKTFRGRIRARAAYVLRDIVETVIGYAYYGHRFPMDPNVIVVLARK